MKSFLRTFIILSAWLLTTQAQAVQITSAGQRWMVDWSQNIGTGGSLGATSTWIVNSYSANKIVLSIDITNTSKLFGALSNADITSFGFGTSSNIGTSLLNAGNVFTRVGTGQGSQLSFPGGFKGINVCLFAQGCSGGSVNRALHSGASDHITLLLTGNFSNGFVDLQYMPLKFQTSIGSFHPAGCVNCQTANVPEPPVGVLLGLGLLLIFLARYRLRSRLAACQRL